VTFGRAVAIRAFMEAALDFCRGSFFGRSGGPPPRCAILDQGQTHVRGRPPSPRFRTIQVWPKDLPAAVRQA